MNDPESEAWRLVAERQAERERDADILMIELLEDPVAFVRTLMEVYGEGWEEQIKEYQAQGYLQDVRKP